jgi:DNA-directed RNA polymerase specialized sigma subunit
VRAELQAIVDQLLAASAGSGEVALDSIGRAIGARAVTTIEIEAIIDALDKAGRKIVGPDGGTGEARLKAVVAAARALGPELGRKPTVAEIATRAGISKEDVVHALALLKVMQS